MLATMLVGVAISRAVAASAASAGAERERGLAREAAEAGLRDGERDVAADIATSADPARAAQFTAAGAGGFSEGCGRGSANRGLCQASSPPAWQVLDLAEAGSAALVPYGHYTGASLATGKGLLPARPPAYLIEKIAPPGATAAMGSFYRITAIGFGSRAATRVVLQSVYRKPPAPPGSASPPPIQLPAGRISWREIANWPQLHAKALE
jgi:type IV pilus assembly protein PilX